MKTINKLITDIFLRKKVQKFFKMGYNSIINYNF